MNGRKPCTENAAMPGMTFRVYGGHGGNILDQPRKFGGTCQNNKVLCRKFSGIIFCGKDIASRVNPLNK